MKKKNNRKWIWVLITIICIFVIGSLYYTFSAACFGGCGQMGKAGEEMGTVTELMSIQCTKITERESSCKINIQTPFILFEEPYQDTAKCELIGVPPVPGGCVLQNISYDKDYISELDVKRTADESGCWAKALHRFVGIKKGNTEIVLKGTCEFDKTYKINIV